MVERRLQVIEVARDAVSLRALSACSGCSGCGGRCDLLRSDAGAASLTIVPERFPQMPQAGEIWTACCDERALAASALRGYGAALLGLLAGVTLGHFAASGLPEARDVSAVLGGAFGVMLALRASARRAPPAFELRRAA